MATAASNPTRRRLGTEGSATRTLLLDAARDLMVREGYAAVTSRRIAAEAGLKPQLIHYYFRSMEDLLLAVLRRAADQTEVHLAKVLHSDQPLRAIWGFSGDPRVVDITTEFTALAVHNPTIRAELGRYAERFRAMQVEAITRHLAARGVKPRMSPTVASVLLISLANTLVREKALGMSMGHAEVEALVETCLSGFAGGDGSFGIEDALGHG